MEARALKCETSSAETDDWACVDCWRMYEGVARKARVRGRREVGSRRNADMADGMFVHPEKVVVREIGDGSSLGVGWDTRSNGEVAGDHDY